MENLNKILNQEDINAVDLEQLLEAKKNKKIDFVLVDIRESFESEDARICDTNYFYPTSDFANNQNKYQDFKDKRIILYCRTSSRTGQVKSILKSMGINNVSHLRGGIMSYMGKTESGSL
jgi:rhodanese-related sulfurtransferase